MQASIQGKTPELGKTPVLAPSPTNTPTTPKVPSTPGVIDAKLSGYPTDQSAEASWIWAPNKPTLADRIDGGNQIKILPKTIPGSWLVVKSRNPLSSEPTPGKVLYTRKLD